MSFSLNTNFERVSEEAHGDAFPFLNSNDQFSDLNLEFLQDESLFADIPVNGTCDLSDIAEAAPNCVEPNELNQYFGPDIFQIHPFECDNKRALMNNLPTQVIVKERKLTSNKVPIELSQSVGVGLPDKMHTLPYKVQIVYTLEPFFRPRYKSDYFAQNGKSRKPRYVADSIGNHYITLRLPVGMRGWIRIDWLTLADKSGDRYSMPYRFQQDNDCEQVPDCNPMYLEARPDKHGIMKVYLVLIKSKQDELKNLQPLKPFRHLKEAFGLDKMQKIDTSFQLNPKQLIQRYQLDRSQLAFTYCAIASDGKTPIAEWDTTVYSTILTETPPKNIKSKAVTCPHCTHVFEMATTGENDGEDSDQESQPTKRKAKGNVIGRRIKKQNSLQNDLTIFQ